MRILLVAAALLAAAPAMAEELTLERVFANPDLSGPKPRAVKLSPDGALVTLLRNRADDKDRYDLWAIDATTGQARMLVDSTKFGGGAISEEEKMRRERARIGGTRGIVAYDWAPDAKSLIVPLDGDLYLAGRDGNVRRLTETAAGELDATVSPAGRFVSFVRDQNLFVLDLASGAERALTRDGGGTLSWGVAEFVAQEEMDRSKGHWWSPGDRRLAVARVDESGVMVVSRAAIGAEGTKVYDQRYPRAGTPNARVDLFVMRPEGGAPVKVDLGGDPDIYLARVDWSPDGETLYVQRQNRAQTRLDLLRVDPDTGASQVFLSERARTWLNLHSDLRVLDDGSLIWSSERSGFNHLYRWKAGKWTQLTKGDWAVKELAGFDKASGRLFFLGNRETPVEQHLYTVDLARPGAVTRLTEPGWWHAVTMDKSGARAIVTRSHPGQPEQVYLADSAGKRIAWIEQNALAAGHPYAPFAASHVAPKFGTIEAADGTLLQTKLLTPRLEPGKRYPVFVQVYGGPGAGRQVTGGWGGGALHQYLVYRGWIVFSVDGRGTPDRGKKFEDHIYRKMGGVEVADQLAGVAWLKQQGFVDPERIAVYGWSYGGYMTLKLLEASPGTFAAGISGAPVTKWELYDTHYTERYMGMPQDGDAYAKSSAIPDAAKIADPLLLIHGMADDNVVFENSTALMAELQGKARPFETMVYPGQTHRVAGEGASVHLWRTIEDFLDRHAGAGN